MSNLRKFLRVPCTSLQSRFSSNFYDTSLEYPLDKYKYIGKICSGSASKLYKANDIYGNTVVIKKINKREDWRNELRILKKLKNKSGLLNYLEHFESYLYMYIVCEYYKLFDLLQHVYMNIPYSEINSKILLNKMLLCIKQCHDNNIAHLDVKFDNFVYHKFINQYNYSIVLIDFGHAEEMNANIPKKNYPYGTAFFLCPEGYEFKRSFKSDIWSFGVCAYLLLTGNFPFDGDEEDEYKHNVLKGDIIYEYMKHLSSISQCFIIKCLQQDPLNRPTVYELLNDDFFK